MITKKHSSSKTKTKTKTKPKTINRAKNIAIEYEGRILDINPEEIRQKVKSLGGKLKAPLTLYRRSVFKLCDVQRGFVRVRDEGDKITMTAKIFKNPDFPEEYELQIKETFEKGQEFLRALNLTEKAYHETIREKWFIPRRKGSNNELCELTIDYIPGLPPYTEIECKTQADLRRACKLLDFKYKDLIFGGYGNVFTHYYGMAANDVNNEISSLTFKNISKELEKYIHKNHDLLKSCATQGMDVFNTISKK